MKILLNKAQAAIGKSRRLLKGVVSGGVRDRRLAAKDREIASLKRRISAVNRSSDDASDIYSQPVFFIVGYQKSGTTWLMKMLNAHREILCQGEGRPFGRSFSRENQSGYPPTSLSHAISGSESIRHWIEKSVWTQDSDISDHLDDVTHAAIEILLTRSMQKSGKRFVGDKTVLLEPEIVQEISEIYPEAKVIHIIRDGRDVVVSATHHVWNQAEDRGGTSTLNVRQREKRDAYDTSPLELLKTRDGMFVERWLRSSTETWSESVSRAAEDGRTLLGENYTEVRYEDLISHPEREMVRLLEFLGASSDEKTVRDCVAAASFEKLSEGRKPGEEAASFFRKGIAGDWKNVFTEQNKRDFKAGAGELLVTLGYENDGNW